MKTKIVVVDDEPGSMLAVLDRLVYLYGNDNVVYHQSPDPVIEDLINGLLPDIKCIISDMLFDLPGNINLNAQCGGIALAREIRKQNESLPIIFYSILEPERFEKEMAEIKNCIHICKTDADGYHALFMTVAKYMHPASSR
jgi:hypothetical protein